MKPQSPAQLHRVRLLRAHRRIVARRLSLLAVPRRQLPTFCQFLAPLESSK